MRGYSLVEVLISTFLLSAVVLSAFSIFESGARQTVSLDQKLTAARLAQKIGEELRSKQNSEVVSANRIPFAPPFESYLYTIQIAPFAGDLNLQHVQKISVTVTGTAGSSMTLPFLFVRQPYP